MAEMNASTAGKSPEQLLGERFARLKTAVACGTPDRVPLSLQMDTFAAKTMGVKFSDFATNVDLAGQTMLNTIEKLSDVDSLQFATYAPAVLGMLWLAPMKLPGRDLPEDSLWQMDEQVRIQPEDYDRILEIGWGPWFGQYIGKYLGEAAAAGQALQEAGPRWAGEYMKRGYVIFSPMTVDHPYEHLCGGRTVKEFTLDLYHMPDKVQAVMDAIMAEKREQTRQMVRAIGPIGYWVGGWRTAPEFLSPRLWDRFVWPYMKELVEIVAEEGGTPVLHYDANWDREIERLKDLPGPEMCPRARRQDRHLPGKEDPCGAHVSTRRCAPGSCSLWEPSTRSRPTVSACWRKSGPTATSWPWVASSRPMPSSRTCRRWSTPCSRRGAA